MREVLLQLALTSNGASASFEASTSGGYYSDVIPRLGQHDAPHLFYARVYDLQETDEGRERVLELAQEELKNIRVSQADPAAEESHDDLKARIVQQGEGYTLDEVARWARCLKRTVREARRDAGRDEEWGRPILNGHELADRDAKIRELAGEGMPARQIALRLRPVSYSTVLRVLGRKK
jgi:hypothetical protein